MRIPLVAAPSAANHRSGLPLPFPRFSETSSDVVIFLFRRALPYLFRFIYQVAGGKVVEMVDPTATVS
jgi:hypothetical protein